MNQNIAFPKKGTLESEGPYHVSRFIKFPVLLSAQEMRDLIASLPPFFLFVTSKVVDAEHAQGSIEDFLKGYERYIEELSEGKEAELAPKELFSSVWTTSMDALYAQEVGKERFLIKIALPVIQVRVHRFLFNPQLGKIYSMSFGKESVSWGVEFSYPHLYQCPKTHEFFSVNDPERFMNTAMFKQIAQFMRKRSIPCPFFSGEQKIATPIRIGQQALDIAAKHSELKLRGLVHAH